MPKRPPKPKPVERQLDNVQTLVRNDMLPTPDQLLIQVRQMLERAGLDELVVAYKTSQGEVGVLTSTHDPYELVVLEKAVVVVSDEVMRRVHRVGHFYEDDD